jgi:hypothetical protein
MEQTATRQKKALGRLPGRTGRRPKAAESGQTLLEFALMLPFMMLLLLGIAEIGRAAFITITVTNAATAGAEYGSQNPADASDDTDMQKRALCDANGEAGGVYNCNPGGILSPPSTIWSCHACACDGGTGISCNTIAWPAPGTDCSTTNNCAAVYGACTGTTSHFVECVQVTTHAQFSPLFHYPGLPTTYQANGKATMRVRQ